MDQSTAQRMPGIRYSNCPSQKDCPGTRVDDFPGLPTDILIFLTRTCMPARSLVTRLWPGLTLRPCSLPQGPPPVQQSQRPHQSGAVPSGERTPPRSTWLGQRRGLDADLSAAAASLAGLSVAENWTKEDGKHPPRVCSPSLNPQCSAKLQSSGPHPFKSLKLVGRPARSGQRGRWWTRPAMQRASPWAGAGRWRARRLSPTLRTSSGRKPLLAPPLPQVQVRPSQHKSRLAWRTCRSQSQAIS